MVAQKKLFCSLLKRGFQFNVFDPGGRNVSSTKQSTQDVSGNGSGVTTVTGVIYCEQNAFTKIVRVRKGTINRNR